MTAEIESQDVVRLMLQFMKENNLMSSMRALQSETGVAMNTVDNIDTFIHNIQHGRWDTVLSQVSTLKLPQDKLIAVRAFRVFFVSKLYFFLIICWDNLMCSFTNKLFWN